MCLSNKKSQATLGTTALVFDKNKTNGKQLEGRIGLIKKNFT
jgi:hypothetical protein